MILAYLLEPNWNQYNLDRLAMAYLHLPAIAYSEIVGKGKSEITMNQAPIEKATPYAAQDADYALEISRLLWPRAEAAEARRAVPRPRAAADRGPGRHGEARRPGRRGGAEEPLGGARGRPQAPGKDDPRRGGRAVQHQLAAAARRRPVPQAAAARLAQDAGDQRRFSTAVDVLEELAPLHPMVGHVLEYRQTTKLKSTYADALPGLIDPATGRIHTSYNQAVASTGRLSSSDPNLQNIPAREETGKRFRRAFIPEDGCDVPRRRLFPDRAAGAGPPVGRSRPDRDRSPRTATSTRRPPAASSAKRRPVFRDGAAAAGQGHQLQRHLRHVGLFAGQGAADVERARPRLSSTRITPVTPGQGVPGRGSWRTRSARAIPRRCSAAGGRSRSCGRRTGTAQQAGRRIALNTPLQGTAADIMKKAMIDIWRDAAGEKD